MCNYLYTVNKLESSLTSFYIYCLNIGIHTLTSMSFLKASFLIEDSSRTVNFRTPTSLLNMKKIF